MEETINLSFELNKYLHEQGAGLVGFADISSITDTALTKAVAVAVPLPPVVVSELVNGPTISYFDAYHNTEARLETIALSAEDFLKKRGFSAFAQISRRITEDENWCTKIPHKTVAVNAGLGWIGKNNLLVTQKFGSALRLSSILTDAPLVCGEASLMSTCGSCSQCVAACPAHALKGTVWSPHTERHEMLDIYACQKKQVELTKKCVGIEAEFLCGKCFAVCPWTRKYIAADL